MQNNFLDLHEGAVKRVISSERVVGSREVTLLTGKGPLFLQCFSLGGCCHAIVHAPKPKLDMVGISWNRPAKFGGKFEACVPKLAQAGATWRLVSEMSKRRSGRSQGAPAGSFQNVEGFCEKF